MCIHIILWESNYFVFFIVESYVVSRYIDLINFNKCCVFIIFRFYLSLLNSSGINISFFLSLLIKLLLLFSCNICYDTFLGSPSFFVSLFQILNIFSTLFYCYHHSLGKIKSSGLVHLSKLILCSYH